MIQKIGVGKFWISGVFLDFFGLFYENIKLFTIFSRALKIFGFIELNMVEKHGEKVATMKNGKNAEKWTTLTVTAE